MTDPSEKTHIQQQTTNQSNISYISDMSDRQTRPIYGSKAIIDDFCATYKGTKEGSAHHIEQAFIEYKVNHPLETHQTVVQQKIVEEKSSKKQELKIRSLTRKINMCMKILKSIKENGIGEKDRFENELLDLVIKGADIPNGGDEFLSLLEEAYSYFE